MWRTAQALARWSPPTPSRQTPWTRLISTVGPAAPATDTSDTPHTPESPESPSHKRDSTAHKAENEQARHTAQARHTDMRARLHAAVLAQTPQHGWTSASVHAAVASLHLSPASSALLPAGIASVAAQLEADVNAQLATALHERGLADIDGQARQPERAATAMHLRLQLLESYHPFWYQAVALRARTPALALRNRLLLTDEVTAYANYMAADMTWYADRAVMATIYQAAEFFWITDSSPKHINTIRFIEARCENAHAARKSVSGAFSSAMNLSDAISSTASTLLRSARTSY